MPNQRIEDYAIIGNCASAALVGRNGSMDWLSVPRFDSPACFAALLGAEENGYWRLAPSHPNPAVSRRYQQGTLVLETQFTTPEGVCVLIDCMHREEDAAGEIIRVFRVIHGIEGAVPMRMELMLRFDYGSVVPWVARLADGRLRAIAGPDMVVLDSSIEHHGEDMKTVADFTVHAGQDATFALSWRASYLSIPSVPDTLEEVRKVGDVWRKWSSQHQPCGKYSEAVLRSLVTLKALTHHQTSGIVAAATTSLPESLGGKRNWDYRYCWLRDATFTLYAMLNAGFTDEAVCWRDWLLRAVAGSPDQMQIMYGVAGERRLTEYEIPWLAGYENSQPVRIGNAASEQLQLDVFGEVLDLLYQARRAGMQPKESGWNIERALVAHLVEIWQQPDAGIWEVRGPNRHFTYSKVMAWVAVDRGIRLGEEYGMDGPFEEWRKVRDQIHAEVCAQGFHPGMNSFVQYYGADTLDASLLLLPGVGFLPPEDPRILGTVKAVEKYLLHDGFVSRYNTGQTSDGVGGEEGVFLACSFWLADNYILQNRIAEAEELFGRALALRNDVGLLAEEYDVRVKRQVGNFPQAFSHVALVNTAHNLAMKEEGPAIKRGEKSVAR